MGRPYLQGISALRHGEAASLRWKHYDPNTRILARLVIATSYDKGHTKTKRTRYMPVHPTLAALLAEWKLQGWPELMGRTPSGAVTYESTRRRPPLLTQAKTSSA
ncbi:MAG: hypothetical protein JXB05_17715 [Myxococcaceae bacterium]|nr:hypothetical protein [Myxococcaceae bacterium]